MTDSDLPGINDPEVKQIIISQMTESYLEGYTKGIVKGIELTERYLGQSFPHLKNMVVEAQREEAAENAKENSDEATPARDIYRGPDPTRPSGVQ